MGRAADTVALSFCLFENSNLHFQVYPPIAGYTIHIHTYIMSVGERYQRSHIFYFSANYLAAGELKRTKAN